MMNRTLSALISAATLATLPLAAHADPPHGALEACSQAFIEHLSATHGAASYRFVPPASSGSTSYSPGARMSRRIDLDLVATSTSTGKVIARAECTATRSGELLSMTTRPAGSSRATALRVSTRTAR